MKIQTQELSQRDSLSLLLLSHFIRSSDVFGSNTLLNRSRELSVFLSPPVSVFIFPFTLFPPFLQLLASQTCQTGSAAVGRGKQIPVKTSERRKIRSAPHNVTSDPSTAWLATWAGELEVEQKRKAHGARWGMLERHPILGAFTLKHPSPAPLLHRTNPFSCHAVTTLARAHMCGWMSLTAHCCRTRKRQWASRRALYE